LQRFIKNIVLITFLLLHFIGANCQTTYKSEKDLKKNAEILFKNENFVAALPLFSQLLSLYPKDPNYSYKFGTCLLMADKRDIEKPIKYLEAASNSPEVEKQLFYYLGLAYHYNYRFKEAINAYNQFLQQAPRSLHKKYDAARQIEMCYNGIALLSSVSDLYVLEKSQVNFRNFYRSYKVSDFGGRFLTLPPELKTKLDIKKEHNPIIFFSENREYLYYSSYGLKDESGKDIYRVAKKPDGTWDKPEKLPNVINTEYDEDYPYILPDGITLFFSSKGHNSMGGYDIFRTVLDTSTNTWSKPENLDFAINTPFDDILFVTDKEMTSAYFASNRVSDIGMINVYKVHLESRTEKDMTALGDVFNLSKDDPAYKRSLELLKNRTKLDVNATDDMFEKPALVADNTDDEYKINNIQQIDTAVNKSLSNQDIIKMAYQQSDELKSDMNELKEKMNATKIVTEQRKQRVLVRMNDAQKAKSDAQRITNPKQREDAIIEASNIQAEADRMQKESEVAENIYKDIQLKVKQKEIEVKNADTYADNIKKAIDSDSPEKALEILNQMNNDLVSEDVSLYTDKTLEEIIADADRKIPETNNEIANLSKELNKLNNEASKLRKEAEQNKDKAKKEDLIAQAQSAELEAKQVQAELNQMTQAVVENKIDTINNNVQNADKQTSIKRKEDVVKNFDENNQRLKNQYAYLINETQAKVNQSSSDYNKAQKLITDADLSTDKNVKAKKLAEAQALIESSEKKSIAAVALNSVANQLNSEIENAKKNQVSLNEDVNKINKLLEKNDVANADKLIDEKNKKYNVDNTVAINDKKNKNELLKKAGNADSEASNSLVTANNSYKKISDNLKEIQNLKNSSAGNPDIKEVEKVNKKIEQIKKENEKLKVDADNAYRIANEKKFEAGKFRMEVSIITSVIPSDSVNNQTSPTALETNNNLNLLQSNLLNEQTKLKESEQQLALADNTEIVEISPEVKANKTSDAEKEKIIKTGDDIQKKYSETIETFVVKANKLYNLAEQKSTVSKIGTAQADKILQNAQNTNDIKLKNDEVEKANKLYEKSFEQAQEAMAAINLAKDYENQVSQLKNDNTTLNNQIAESKKLVDAGNLKDAEKQLQKIQDEYSSQNIEAKVENKVKQSAESDINKKQLEAQDLANASKKQYEEAQKLKDESNNLKTQAQNTNDQNKKNSLLNNANQLDQQALTAKKKADDNYNKGEKIKIQVGVLKMKVDYTVSVEDMPEAKDNKQNSKPNVVADVDNLQQTIEKHDFSETNKESLKIGEEQNQNAKQLTVENKTEKQTTKQRPNDIKGLEEEINKNSQLAAEEKKKAASTPDLNKRMDIMAKANEYEQNVKDDQLQIYEIQSKNNKDQINNNKAIIKGQKGINEDDDNAKRGKMLEAESDIYVQKADSRRKEAQQTDNTALKVNIMEDAVRNEQLALKKQEESIGYYKMVEPPVKQTTAQIKPVVKETNTQVANKTEQPVKTNQTDLTNKVNNKANQAVVANPQLTQNIDDKNLITNIKGLFFTVQIGVFGATRTAEQLLNLVPIYYDKLNNGFYRYFSGIFNSKEAAVTAKNIIIGKGIADAFVVAFNNGIRITVNDAVALLQNGQGKLQNQIAFTSQTAAEKTTEQPLAKTDFYYAVQIGVYKQQRSSAQLFNISPVTYESLPNGFQRHLTGHFNNRETADNTKNEIVRKGIADAFVVAYLNGKRITLAEARDYESGAKVTPVPKPQANNTNAENAPVETRINVAPQPKPVAVETPNYKAKDISYKVQIGAFRQSVAPLILKQYKTVLKENITEIKTDAGLTIYLVGNFKDFLKASALRSKVVNSGINDAFVVAYNKNKRIPLNVAREILK